MDIKMAPDENPEPFLYRFFVSGIADMYIQLWEGERESLLGKFLIEPFVHCEI